MFGVDIALIIQLLTVAAGAVAPYITEGVKTGVDSTIGKVPALFKNLATVVGGAAAAGVCGSVLGHDPVSSVGLGAAAALSSIAGFKVGKKS